MKHYIITRFNYPDNFTKIQERLDLFNKYTKRSILAQTNKNFTWLILGTPDIKLDGISHDFIPSGEDKHKVFKFSDEIRKYIDRNNTFGELIVTSRLDNDDFALPNYTKVIQNIAILKRNLPFIIEPRGYLYDERINKCKYNDRYKLNNTTSPFISMVENNNGNLKLCYFMNHSKMGRNFTTLKANHFIYVQIIHDNNWTMNKVSFEGFQGTELESIEGFNI